MSIELFQHFNYGGEKVVLGTEADSFKRFNDEVSSCVVKEGTWLLYSDFNFQGKVSILTPGSYPNPTAMGITNDTLSSLRPLPVVLPSIVIFQDYDFRGRMVHLTGPTTDLRVIGFNDKASSAIVINGTWRMWEHVGLKGKSFDLAMGQHPRLGDNDTLSSVSPV